MVKIDELERQVDILHLITAFFLCRGSLRKRREKRQAAIDEEIRGLVENCALATDISMKYIDEKIGELEVLPKNNSSQSWITCLPIPHRTPLLQRRIFSGKKEAAALLIDRIEIDGRKIDIYWKTDI